MKRLLILLIPLILLFLSWTLHAVYAQTEKLVPIEHVSSIYEEQLDYPSGIGDRCYLIFLERFARCAWMFKCYNR